MFREYWRRFYRKCVDAPVSAISTVVGLILAISGLIGAVFGVASYLGLAFGFGLAWFIVLCVVSIMMVYVDKNFSNVYKVSKSPKYLYQKFIQRWRIDSSGGRSVYCKKVIVFYEKPESGDLVDTIMGSVGLSYKDLKYSTKDATISHYVQTRGNAINLYWKPRAGEIQVGDSYVHEFEYMFPKGEGAVPKSTTVASIAPVRHLEMSIETEIELQGLSIKENDGSIDFWDTDKIFAEGKKSLIGPIKSASSKRLNYCSKI